MEIAGIVACHLAVPGGTGSGARERFLMRKKPTQPRRRGGPPPPRPGAASAGPQRLQKVLAACGVGSRRQCEEYIALGRVTVDDRVVTELGTRVEPAHQSILLDGEPVQAEPKVYWWLHKPPGILCTSRDPQGRPTVLDAVPNLGRRIYSVGRLDEESTGLLLLTNDGPLAHRLTHPRFGVAKTYRVLVSGKIGSEAIRKLLEGVWLADGKVRAHAVRRGGLQGQATWLEVVLCEGHNREIRRMFAQLGHKVMRLQRIAIGPIKLRKLRLGEARPATPPEVSMLRQLARNAPRERVVRPPRESQPRPAAHGDSSSRSSRSNRLPSSSRRR